MAGVVEAVVCGENQQRQMQIFSALQSSLDSGHLGAISITTMAQN
jgi:hypothetical protein